MVGYDPNHPHYSRFQQIQVGAATSIFSRFLVQPLDVVKIRFQLQHEAISKNSIDSKYYGVRHCLSTVFKEEGLFGLWKGHLSGQFLSISFVTTQYLWFQQLTMMSYLLIPNSYETEGKKLKPKYHFLCGGLAAGLTVFTSQPLDVIRTRLVAQGEPRIYKNMTDAAKQIWLHEGFRGLYKGTLASIILTAPEAAFRFGIYQFLNNHWDLPKKYILDHIRMKETKEAPDDQQVGIIQSSINGGLAGIFAKTIVYPFDVVKKRLQIQGFEEARVQFGRYEAFSGVMNCLSKTIRQEGLFGLYKGYLPSMSKAFVSSGLVFLMYEQFAYLAQKFDRKK